MERGRITGSVVSEGEKKKKTEKEKRFKSKPITELTAWNNSHKN